VLDDNHLELILYLLRSYGYDAVGVERASGALEALQSELFNAALVDLLMPEMEGFEFARRVRSNARLAAVPLIAITALAMVGDRERALGSGFDGYIPKPIEPERFISQLQLIMKDAQQRSAPQASAGPRVLVVDDIEVNRQVIRGALAPFGYRIAEASHAADALQQVRREKPALILCHVHMPARDGFELAQDVKREKRRRQIPFIFISSTAWQTADRRRAMELGANRLILRPIDPQKLLDEVRAALGVPSGQNPRR
jgi:two-component system cell cycle response regulator